MSTLAELRCRCGELRGSITNASRRTVNRVVCYCDDCQAFAHQLGRADLLDAGGGTDIIQVAPATLKFVQGQHRIVGLRLTSNGLFRWYANCCNTPVGNAPTPVVPFVGIIAQAFDTGAQQPDDLFGKPIGAIQGEYAIGGASSGSTGIKLSLIIRAIRMVLGWRLRGQTWPHPFFDRATRAPIYPVSVLSREQRDGPPSILRATSNGARRSPNCPLSKPAATDGPPKPQHSSCLPNVKRSHTLRVRDRP